MIWDPLFGWDYDRIRMVLGWTAFLFLFSGFIASTEGESFFYPVQYVASWLKSHEVGVLIATAIFSMMLFYWWRREQGW